MREAVGDDTAIAIRIAADTLDGAGIEPEEGLAFVRAAEPLVDLFDCVVGGLAGASRLDAGASRFFATGYQLEWTARFREATDKPIVGTGLMVDPDVMADVIESGVWNLIGAARPSIADPFLPVKIEQGRYDEIRACIGCNACYALANRGGHLGCTQNATAGEEYRRGWHPERFERAANAGSRRARRGRRARRAWSARSCSPSAASSACGSWTRPTRSAAACAGSRTCPASTPGRASSTGAGARSAGSPTSSSRRACACTPPTCGRAAPTWSWSRPARTGRWTASTASRRAPSPAPMRRCRTSSRPSRSCSAESRSSGARVVVIDVESYHVGASLALRLAGQGHEVTIATPSETVAAWCNWTLEGPRLREQLHATGVVMLSEATAEEILPGAVRLRHAYGGAPFDVKADCVVLVTQRLSNEALYLELAGDADALAAAGIEAVYRTGDCVAPRWLVDTVFDGHRLAREIDGPDPHVYLPTAARARAPALGRPPS